MVTRPRTIGGLLCALLILVVSLPATAQIEDQLGAYTGPNATGYLQPLADAFGATLNDAFWFSAFIPTSGLRLSLEIPVMGVIFADDQRTFSATTESPFLPQQTVDVPTIVGSPDVVSVPGQGATTFVFPGGLDLNSFGLAVPQLRVAGVRGTEAVVRYIAFDTGDAEIGDISLFGFGARHSISQYLEDFPVELAGGFMYQSFSVGENSIKEDLISSNAFTIGVQASKQFPLGFAHFEPFTGLSIDRFGMDVQYDSDTSGTVDLKFDTETNIRWNVGVGLNFVAGHIYGSYSLASQKNFAFGFALGNLGI